MMISFHFFPLSHPVWFVNSLELRLSHYVFAAMSQHFESPSGWELLSITTVQTIIGRYNFSLYLILSGDST